MVGYLCRLRTQFSLSSDRAIVLQTILTVTGMVWISIQAPL